MILCRKADWRGNAQNDIFYDGGKLIINYILLDGSIVIFLHHIDITTKWENGGSHWTVCGISAHINMSSSPTA